jgi:hypothetical protein
MELNEEQLDQLLEGCKTLGDVDTQKIIGGAERRFSSNAHSVVRRTSGQSQPALRHLQGQ